MKFPFASFSLFMTVASLVSVFPAGNLSRANASPQPSLVVASAFQPVARINPNQPYRVQILNQTGTVLEYSSTTNEFPPRRLNPNATATVSQLPASVYLLISPVDGRFNLKFAVSANPSNVVTVRVTQLPEEQPGNTTVNIQNTGGIYIY
jgi:hypothetical protein